MRGSRDKTESENIFLLKSKPALNIENQWKSIDEGAAARYKFAG